MAELNIGTLSASLLVKDAFSSAFSSFTKGLENIGGPIPAIVGGIAAITGVTAALTATIVALGERGAEVNDISESFEALNAVAGNSKNVLSALDQGLAGTVSKFDIMKASNMALAQGLKLTDTQFKTLGEASRVIADQMGTSNLQAFESLTTALATGRDRTLKFMGVQVDAKKAMEDYARSIGRTSAELNNHQQLEAKRIAIMAALEKKLFETGHAQDDFSDTLARMKVGMQNFTDALASAVAKSPVLNAAMDSTARAIHDAFGTNQVDAVKTLVDWVNKFVIGLLKVSEVVVLVAEIFVGAWYGMSIAIEKTLAFIAKVAQEQVGAIASVLEAAAKIPVVGTQYESAAKGVRAFSDGLGQTAKMYDDMAKKDIASGIVNVGALDDAANGLNRFTKEMQMVAQGVGPMQEEVKKSTDGVGALGEAMEHATVFSKAMDDAQKGLHDALMEGADAYEKERDGILQATQAAIKALDARKDLTAAEKNSIANVILETQAMRLQSAEQRHIEDLTKEYIKTLQDQEDELDRIEEMTKQYLKTQEEGIQHIEEMTKQYLKTQEEGIQHIEEMTKQYLADEEERRQKQLQGYLDWAKAIRGVSGLLQDLGVSGSNTFVQLADGLADGIEHAVEFAKATTTAQKAMALVGAAQSAAQSGSALKGAMTGAMTGFAVGGPIGAGIGAIAGGLLGVFGGAAKARKEIAAMKDELVKNAGGMSQLRAKAAEAGVDIDKVFAIKKVGDFKQAIEVATKAIKDMEDATKAHDEAWEKTKEAAREFGLTVAELGPKFAQQMLVENGMAVWEKWRLLVAAGADVVVVTQKMAQASFDTFSKAIQDGKSYQDALAGMDDGILKFAYDAIASGQAIPMAMKPMIDALIASGMLVDANGQAFKSAEDAGITFSETMDEKFKTLIESIQLMVDALNGIHPKPIDIPINYNVTTTQGTETNHGKPPGYASGSDGFQDFGSGMFAMLHGVEAVITKTQWDGMLAQASSSSGAVQAAPSVSRQIDATVNRDGGVQRIEVPINIAGRTFDKVVLERGRGGFFVPPSGRPMQ